MMQDPQTLQPGSRQGRGPGGWFPAIGKTLSPLRDGQENGPSWSPVPMGHAVHLAKVLTSWVPHPSCLPFACFLAVCSDTAGCELNTPETFLILHCRHFSALKHLGGLICFLK